MSMKTPARTIFNRSLPMLLVSFALPVILGNMLQAAYIAVDTFWVGQLGGIALAAISLCQPVVFFIFCMGSGLSIAGATLVAQYLGKGQQVNAHHAASQTFLMAILFAFLISLIAQWVLPWPISLFHADKQVTVEATRFLRIALNGLVLTFGFAMMQALLRGAGNVLPAMLVLAGSVVINGIIDPILIFGYFHVPAMGVSGAAAATLFSQGLALVAVFVLMSAKRFNVQIKWCLLLPQRVLMGTSLKIALPASIELTSVALAANVMTYFVSYSGTSAIATYGVVTTCNLLISIPAMGLSMAVSTLVGQHLGAGLHKRMNAIVRISALSCLAILTCIGLAVLIMSRVIMGLITPGDVMIIQLGSEFLTIVAWSYGIMGVQMVLGGAIRATGKTSITMVISIVTQWLIQIPLSWLLALYMGFGVQAILCLFPITYCLEAVVMLLMWLRIR